MTRVDFYQLSRDPVEQVVPLLACKVLDSGARLVIVSEDAVMRDTICDGLWSLADGAFLANGPASDRHAARHPILVSDQPDAPNGASMAIYADGAWRDAETAFERIMLLFAPDRTDRARDLWRRLSSEDGWDLHIYKQQGNGAWREGR